MLKPILTSISQPLYNLSDGGPLLSNGDVNAVQLLLLVISLVEPLLVDDGVDGQGSLSSLTISNDQLTLSTTDGYKGVDGLDTCMDKGIS